MALVISASLMMRRWSICVDFRVPAVIIFLASGRLAELRRRIHDSSWSRELRFSRRNPAACADALIGGPGV